MTYRKRLLLFGSLDACTIAASIIVAYLLRFDFDTSSLYFNLLPYVIIPHIVFTLCAFFWVKLYQRVLKFAGTGELVAIITAASIAEVGFYTLVAIERMVYPLPVVPRSIYFMAWGLIILGTGGSRFAVRMFDGYSSRTGQYHRNVLIIGAGSAGVLVAKGLIHSSHSHSNPIAFIDDDFKQHHLKVMGLPVVGGRNQIHRAVEHYDIDDIVIAIPSASKQEITKIIDICKTTKASVKIIPSVAELINGKVLIEKIRDVQVEDLLGREPVQVDLESMAKFVTDQVVLITGAGGSIGSELCRQIASFHPKCLVVLGHGENSIYEIHLELRESFPYLTIIPVIGDIQDRGRVEAVFKIHLPAVVFHAAAHKHVPLMEQNPEEAIKNNILGTRNIAECAHIYDATHFVMISSDKAVNPTSVMGATKRFAEIYIQGLDRVSRTKFVAVRFGNVLGSRGSVIPLFKRQIQSGGPVTVTHPQMVRYFMTISEAVQLTIQAGALALGGEIFVLDMGQPVKIVDLARDMITLSGLKPDVEIPIVFSGIRPGEKLYEELLTEKEIMSATKHDRIFVGKPSAYSWDEIQGFIEKLGKMATTHDPNKDHSEIREVLQRFLPEYRQHLDAEPDVHRVHVAP